MLVDAYSRHHQVQEKLFIQIRDFINRTLNPKEVVVAIDCTHMCMQMKGV